MCGLAGFLGLTDSLPRDLDEIGALMATTIAHRGPDDSGVWSDDESGICLAFQRLAIVDLSMTGHQPMSSASNRYKLVFNGEIYNHFALRAELEAAQVAPKWRGHSDTETLLAAVDHYGVEGALKKCVGMFAIALWDATDKRLFLARDRMGEKPLYYGWVAGALVFGSELKAIRAYPGFSNAICRDALSLYFKLCSIPAPFSIYEDIFKLAPGCILTIDENGLSSRSIRIEPYWRLEDAVAKGLSNPFESENEALDALERCLLEVVRGQAIADVPLGAFLSGGVDSSTIVALMQSQSHSAIKTFTVGFDEEKFDEAPYARKVSDFLGTDHNELRLTAQEAMDVIPKLPTLYDEPFADSSQIPTYLICKAARDFVSVALSGDAGDELFGGYTRYLWSRHIWDRVGWLPLPVRRTLGRAIQSVPDFIWNTLDDGIFGANGVARLSEKSKKLAYRLETVETAEELYQSLLTEWRPEDNLVLGGRNFGAGLRVPAALTKAEIEQRMMYFDSVGYLPDDILVKVDRAAMGVSLETRIPFLDHRLVELAWRVPLEMKIRNSQGKWLLRQLLYKYVPKELIERPKVGFSIPLGLWLRGPLRDWAEALIDEKRLVSEGVLNPAPILKIWREHQTGRYDWTARLWSVLMFQAWLEESHR